jgi:hypothetical protein
LESHGGYLFRANSLEASVLVELARRALRIDDVPASEEVSLLVGVLPHRKLVRVAFDAPFTYGRRGALWYDAHHALARLVSRELDSVVQAYVYDADEMEHVVSYARGSRVGGERLLVEDFEFPDEDDEEIDDEAFEKLKEKWPLGHLARVFGLSRDDLVRMPRLAQGVLLDLENPDPVEIQRLRLLFPKQRQASGM